jgi:hypothetical protein
LQRSENQSSMSISIPEPDDRDEPNGYTWSFPNTPSAHSFGKPQAERDYFGDTPIAQSGAKSHGFNSPNRGTFDFGQSEEETVTLHRKESSPVPLYTPNTAFAFPQSHTSSPMTRTRSANDFASVDLPPMSSPSISSRDAMQRTSSAIQLPFAHDNASARPMMLRQASVAVMERSYREALEVRGTI